MQAAVPDEDCPICNVAADGDVDVCVTECGHRYHLHCMMEWTRTQGRRGDGITCPICRQDLLVPTATATRVSGRTTRAVAEPPTADMLSDDEFDDIQSMGVAVQAATALMESLHADALADTCRALVACVRHGDTAGADSILSIAPLMINHVGQDGLTPLHHAAATGRVGVVAYLLGKRAQSRERTHEGLTPLHMAVMARSLSCATLLVTSGANVDDVDHAGNTPLFAAIKGCDRPAAVMLLIRGANADARNLAGDTVMHAAATCRCPLMMQTVATYSRTLDRPDAMGNTPLHVAAMHGNAAFVTEFSNRLRYSDRFRSNTLGRTPEEMVASGHSPSTRLAFHRWVASSFLPPPEETAPELPRPRRTRSSA